MDVPNRHHIIIIIIIIKELIVPNRTVLIRQSYIYRIICHILKPYIRNPDRYGHIFDKSNDKCVTVRFPLRWSSGLSFLAKQPLDGMCNRNWRDSKKSG